MQSVNHQFVEFGDQVVARYVSTVISPISGYRLDPRNAVNPNNRIDFLLATPEKSLEILPYDDGEPTKIRQKGISYEDEVLELYSEAEVKSFRRMNRSLIENGILIPYDGSMPDINTVNILTDVQMRKIAKTKTTNVFREQVDGITSVVVLNKLLELMEDDEDAKYAHIKYIKARISEMTK